MALIGNYQVLNKTPGRWLGGDQLAGNRSNWTTNGSMRGVEMQDGVTTANEYWGVPTGTEPPYCWMLPEKGGELASTTLVAGSGSLTNSNLAMGLAANASLTGSGDITAASLGLIVSLAASLAGTGDITTAQLQAIQSLAASLTGTGDVTTASLQGIASLLASLTGTGDLTASSLSGLAELEADITVTGELLTTANVGQYVWDYLLATGYSASEAMDILTAVAAGKVSGGPTDPVFRSIDDTRDVVSGTADSSGNRSVSTITAEG